MESHNQKNYDHKTIFYLILEPKTPAWSLLLSSLLAKNKIYLIPVNLDQLLKLIDRKNNNHVFISNTNLSSHLALSPKVKKIIKMLVMGERITLHHLSSFENSAFLSLNQNTKKYYHFHRAPMDLNILCDEMTLSSNSISNTNSLWPGGRRATLSLKF